MCTLSFMTFALADTLLLAVTFTDTTATPIKLDL